MLLVLLAPAARGQAEARGGIVGALGGEPPARASAGEPEPGEGFAAHVREAIALNRARCPIYSAMSGGVSEDASRALIWSERLTLPWAALLDLRARRFGRRGIGVIRDEFVPMSGARPPTAPPRYRGVADDDQADRLCAVVRRAWDAVDAALGGDDLEGAARAGRAGVRAVARLEAEQGCHWALTKHVLEQIARSASLGARYAVVSDGATRGLTKTLVRSMGLGLLRTARIDRDAQQAHALGVGVVVNDLPPIPLDE